MTLEELVRRKYDERRELVTATIIGGVKSYEEYRFQIGTLRGMYDLYEDIKGYVKDPDAAEDDAEGA